MKTSDPKPEPERVETEENEIEPKELLDRSLGRALVCAFVVYLLTLSILSFPLGNTFATVLATPISAISFFLISRWDRLRGNDGFVFVNLRHALGLDKIRLRPIMSGFLCGQIYLFVMVYFLIKLTGVHPEDLCACATGTAEELEAKGLNSLSILATTGYIGSLLFGYFVVGFFSAISSFAKGASVYLHSALSACSYLLFNLITAEIVRRIDDSDGINFFNDPAESMGSKVLVLSIWPFISMLGTKVATMVYRKRLDSSGMKLNDDPEYRKLVAAAIERSRPATGAEANDGAVIMKKKYMKKKKDGPKSQKRRPGKPV